MIQKVIPPRVYIIISINCSQNNDQQTVNEIMNVQEFHQISLYLNHRMFRFSGQYCPQICNISLFQQSPYQLCYLPISHIYLIGNSSLQAPVNYESPQFQRRQLQIDHSLPQEAKLIPNSQRSQEQDESKQVIDKQVSNNYEVVSQVNEQSKQKFGRNICSNIFHLMVKFVKKEKKMKCLVLKIIQSNNMKIKANQFYQMIKNRSYKLKAYVSLLKIKEFWKGPLLTEPESARAQKQVECTKIFRIIGRHYLKYCHFPYVFSSLKIKSESKKLHMEAIRKILSL